MRRGDNPWYEVRLIEGRNQQIRIMFKHFGPSGRKAAARADRYVSSLAP